MLGGARNAVPVVACGVGLLGGIFIGGFIAAITGATWSSVIGVIMLWVFSWIPVAGWIAMGAVAVIGVALLVTSIVTDHPRRTQVKAIQEERRNFIRAVNESHKNDPPMVEAPPLTTVMRF